MKTYYVIVSKSHGRFLHCEVGYFTDDAREMGDPIQPTISNPKWTVFKDATLFYSDDRLVRLAGQKAGLNNFDVLEYKLVRDHCYNLKSCKNWRGWV